MRKKYLSALLFGALLVTSAGTFTSCKDYDDDIKNLQEQIDVIKTDLASLTETVNNLDGVKTLSYADGKLIIETGKGTKVEVPVPSATGVTEVKLEGNVLYVDGKEAGKVEIPEGETVKVEVKEDGKLYINDEVQDLEVGSKVVMVDNGDGTYTMTVDGKSYILPKATSSITVLTTATFDDPFTFTEVADDVTGINWAKASKDIDWKGPKGAIKSGDLLVGQITETTIRVTPSSVNLSDATLKLVDSKGNDAPATVKAVKVEDDAYTTTTRAVSQSQWTLKVEPKAENMGSDFTNGENKNLKYALSVDGNVVTDYVFVIDTEEKANNATSVTCSTGNVRINSNTIDTDGYEAGKTYEVSYIGSSIYDYMIAFNKGSETDASRDGAKIEGNKIVVPAASSGKTYAIDITIIDVNGNTKTGTFNFKVTTANIGEDEVAESLYKVNVDKSNIIVNLEDVFSSLTDAQATSIESVVWYYEPTTNDFLVPRWNSTDSRLATTNGITYYNTEADAKAGTNGILTTDVTNNKVKDIKFAAIPLYSGDYNNSAKEGTFDLTLKITTTNKEVKTVTVPVKVELPTFDELFVANPDLANMWSGSTYTTRIFESSSNPAVSLYSAFVKADGSKANVDDLNLDKFTFVDDNDTKQEVVTSTSDITAGITLDKTRFVGTDDKIKYDTFNTEVSYTFGDAAELTVKKAISVKVMSIFEGAKLVHVVNKQVVTAPVKLEGTTNAYTISTTDLTEADKDGIALQFAGETKKIISSGSIAGLTYATTGSPDLTFTITSPAMGATKGTIESSGLKMEYDSVIETGTVGTLNIEVVDGTGIKTDMSIKYQR